MLRRDAGEEGVSILRSRLEFDANFVAPQIKKGAERITACVAARLASQVDCSLDPGTPHYLHSAMEPSVQARLICDSDPPYHVTWASPAWHTLTGLAADVVGRPVLSLLTSGQSSGSEVGKLLESLHLHQRGCSTVICSTAMRGHGFPAHVTVNPLIDASSGASRSMLFVVKPL